MISARKPKACGVSSHAALIILKLLATFLLLALAGGACARPGTGAQPQTAAESGGGPPGSNPNAATVTAGEEPARDTRPLALQAAAPGAPRPAVVQAAASLAGHDRFLVLGDGPPIPAADFLIGALALSEADERLAPLSLLRAGLGKGELNPKAFSLNSGRITSLVFGEAYSKAKAAEELRLSLPSIVEGGLALRFRLLGDELSALGELILHSESGGTWLIGHFELDREALSLPRQRFERWEPPLALYP